jgi:UDP-N-acetylglucosamine:LPS N-acetylglucosamine transferase
MIQGHDATHGQRPSDDLCRSRRVLLVSSSGGVLDDLIGMRPWWEGLERRWVAVRAADTEQLLERERTTWQDDPTLGAPLSLVRAVLSAERDLAASPVDLVVSAGTAVAVPYFIAARRRGITTWWVETFNMVGHPGRAARICSALATRTLVQRPHLLGDRRRSVWIGELS